MRYETPDSSKDRETENPCIDASLRKWVGDLTLCDDVDRLASKESRVRFGMHDFYVPPARVFWQQNPNGPATHAHRRDGRTASGGPKFY